MAEPARPTARRRGPKPKFSDEDLLAAVLADLEASPFEGEGYRKVWARLRVQQGIRVSRTRVRDNNLRSPQRARDRDGRSHDGTIITDARNVMWGTDGVRVFTSDDGWGWIFPAVDHWNAACVGWHVCKKGDRFAALEPIKMRLARLYGSTAAGAARGLSLRMDHGTQYLSHQDIGKRRRRPGGAGKVTLWAARAKAPGCVARRVTRMPQHRGSPRA